MHFNIAVAYRADPKWRIHLLFIGGKDKPISFSRSISMFEKVIIFGLIIGAYLVFSSRAKRNRAQLESDAMQSLQSFYSTLDKDVTDYEFFGEGHDYYWVRMTQNEVEAAVIDTCHYYQQGMPFSNYSPHKYAIKVDEENSAIYVVCFVDDFCIDSKKPPV